jgi:hypothetical protein
MYNKQLALKDLSAHYNTLLKYSTTYDAIQFLNKLISEPQSNVIPKKEVLDDFTILWTLQIVGNRVLVHNVEHTKTNRAQREFGKDRFIMVLILHYVLLTGQVRFPIPGDDMVENEQLRESYRNILENGFKLAERKWEFFGFSKGQLKRGCGTFIATRGYDILRLDEVSASTARDWAGDFSSFRAIAKCAVRLGLSLKPCVPTLALSDDQWAEYPDVEHDGYIFTKG